MVWHNEIEVVTVSHRADVQAYAADPHAAVFTTAPAAAEGRSLWWMGPTLSPAITDAVSERMVLAAAAGEPERLVVVPEASTLLSAALQAGAAVSWPMATTSYMLHNCAAPTISEILLNSPATADLALDVAAIASQDDFAAAAVLAGDAAQALSPWWGAITPPPWATRTVLGTFATTVDDVRRLIIHTPPTADSGQDPVTILALESALSALATPQRWIPAVVSPITRQQ